MNILSVRFYSLVATSFEGGKTRRRRKGRGAINKASQHHYPIHQR